LELDAIGFGSLNLDEFWEVETDFLTYNGLEPGHEYVKDLTWFQQIYPSLQSRGTLKASDPGGSAANMIAALNRMGFRTGFFGATGEKDAERLRLHELGKPQHVLVKLLDIPAGRCLALINREDTGRDRCLVILPNANDHAGQGGIDLEKSNKAKWIHLTSFVSGEPLNAQCLLVERVNPEIRVSFDPGVVYVTKGLDALLPILKRTSILFTTEEELEILVPYGETHSRARTLIELGIETVVVKQGAKGILAYDTDETNFQPSVSPKEIIDRTGAGDVAAAGFLAGKLRNLSTKKCLHLAALAASRSIEGFGRSAYPDSSILDKIE
jgi:ribokinase